MTVKKNRGLFIQESDGEWVWVVNGKEIILDTLLQRVVEAAKHHDSQCSDEVLLLSSEKLMKEEGHMYSAPWTEHQHCMDLNCKCYDVFHEIEEFLK